MDQRTRPAPGGGALPPRGKPPPPAGPLEFANRAGVVPPTAGARPRPPACKYCMAHTADGPAKLGVEQQKLDAVWDYQASPLFSAAERAALDVAIAAGCVPNAVTDEMFFEL